VKAERNRWRKFLHLPAGERMILLEAVVLQMGIWLLLKLVPYKMLPRLFSDTDFKESSPETEKLKLIKNAVQRSSGVIRLHNRCLVSSLTARCMLRRRNIPSKISLGVARGSGGKIRAHAWIIAGNFEVVEQMGDYTVLHVF